MGTFIVTFRESKRSRLFARFALNKRTADKRRWAQKRLTLCESVLRTRRSKQNDHGKTNAITLPGAAPFLLGLCDEVRHVGESDRQRPNQTR
jgi:hypothetical protein